MRLVIENNRTCGRGFVLHPFLFTKEKCKRLQFSFLILKSHTFMRKFLLKSHTFMREFLLKSHTFIRESLLKAEKRGRCA